nr:ATP-binding cassette domain-containing protein [Nocardioides sp. S5]
MSAPALEVRGISKAFGGLQALSETTFSIEPGESVGVIGPNGAGKSTLLSLISGYQRPDAGSVILEGQEVTRRPAWRRARAGLVRAGQDSALFDSLTVRETLTLALAARRVRDEGDTGTLSEIVNRMGLGPSLDVYPAELSLPDRRHLELAKCIAARPSMLVMDEPLAGLNREQAVGPIGLINELHRSGTTVLIVEHVLPLLWQIVDRVIVLNFGKVLADGTPEEIVRDPAVRESYLGLEYKHDA